MRALAVLAGALVLCPSCGTAHDAGARPPGFTGLSLASLAPAAADATSGRWLGYRWEGSGTVPWPFDGTPARLDFGPVGRTPSTLLYLTFEGPLQREIAAQEPRWALATPADAGAAVEGRHGSGLALAEGESLSLACEAAPSPAALTLELWIRAEREDRGPILDVPGLLRLERQPKGALRLESRGTALTTPPGALAAGRWAHLGLVVDPELESLRLVVDDRPHRIDLARLDPLPAVERLELGGGRSLRLDELRLSGRAANTSELIEAWETRARPLERVELATSAGTRTLEVWTDYLRDAVVDGQEEWARGELEHALADGDGLRWVEGHWRRIRAPDPPPARTCHPTVYLGDGRLFVFSGEVRDSHLWPLHAVPDTWFFHTRGERWERLPAALAPPGRCHQQAAFSPDHDLVLMPGGWGNGVGVDVKYDDTWVFHVAERRWERREPGGDAILPGGEQALVYHPRLRRFLMFQQSAVYAYEPTRDRWDRRPPVLIDEQGRPSDYFVPHSLTAAVDPVGGAVVLFGGARGDPHEFCERTLVYEPRDNRLVVLDPATGPSARVRPGFAYDSRRARMVLFGGVRDQFSLRMDDLWSFDPASRRWTRHEASGTPSPRGGYMHMAYEPELDRFFLLCGRHSPERFLEEAWSLALDERAAGRARYAFDRAGFAEREWSWEGATPGDSALEFRFRASADGLAWGEWSPVAPAAERYLEVEVTLRPGSAGERPALRAMGFRART